MSSRTLDLCGLKCPLPVLRTRKALATLLPGDRLVVVSTDLMSAIDIPNLVRETGDTLVRHDTSETRQTFLIEKQ
ncbi:sulfurtransferase TusA family protein [Flaviflagellibacter deserti]|jgi:tRNA 2-thiouridine synthesizing protein A|uniref:Sulfurtransferase TusA family protein n=1 Tax=Flaviflagellibacter deserti TaxID=2267266 RepID=A0ABV9Z4V2_9HYPH